ncbi:MAG: Trk system potassium transporter TrkA [Oscillospiraceae bacterium]|jgi:trk system potassium uptake protein TrkA|nr:Trk system potassium transporter TrkA [Oscillospiraceae bacterium]
MNVVIVGAGKVGYSLARQLSMENHDVTVIDAKAERIEFVSSNLDVFALMGNGASFEIQKSAGVENANLLIAATNMDEVNILCCIVAKKLGVPHTIARVRNPEYTKQVVFLRDELGLSMSINPEQATAEEISRVLRFPSASKMEPFAKGRAELVELRIPESSPLCGMTVSDIHPKYKVKILVSVVERAGRAVIPSGDFALRPGDKISIVGSPVEQSRFFQVIGMKKDRVRNVMVIGAGKITVYLTQQLLDMGMHVKIIEKDREKCLALKNKLERATVVCGDGTKPELLMEEGLAEADAVIALTGMDESNIITAVYAKTACRGVVIAKVNETHFSTVLERTGIDVTVQPSSVTVQRIVHYVRAMENTKSSTMETLYLLNDGKVEAIQFKVGGAVEQAGTAIKDMRIRKDVQISAILRDGKCLIPGGNDTIRTGDDVIVTTTSHDIGQIGDIFEG